MLLTFTIGIIVLNIALGASVLLQGRKDAGAKFFFLITLAFSLLSYVNYYSLLGTTGTNVFWIRLVMLFAACHTYLFFLFVHFFGDNESPVVRRPLFLRSLPIFLAILAITQTPLLFSGTTMNTTGQVDVVPGKLLPLFSLWLLGTMILSMRKVVLRFRASEGTARVRWKYLLIGTFTTYSALVLFNFVFASFLHNSYFVQFTPFYSLPLIIAIGYAVIKHNLFDIKVLATQAFVFILVTVFVAKVLVASTLSDRIIDGIILVITIFFGILLVRSVQEEVRAREEIRKLADELAKTNVELEVSNERLRIMDQRKSEFVSIASHQLRTPVTAMKGYSSLLLEDAYGKLPDAAKEPVQRIFDSTQRLVNMINDFLNVSKIEQGTMEYHFAPLDLGKMARELVDDFHVVAGKKNIDLAVVIPENERFAVVADEGKIRQILSNLIDNSIKYTPQGSVRVILEKEPEKGPGMIHLMIKDTGIGLSQDDIHHLFGKFTRGSEGSKVNTSGSGLGLYVAKQMMEKHSGNIWVDSEGKGKGSTFSIELPEWRGELPK